LKYLYKLGTGVFDAKESDIFCPFFQPALSLLMPHPYRFVTKEFISIFEEWLS
jgi:hypothetical protein